MEGASGADTVDEMRVSNSFDSAHHDDGLAAIEDGGTSDSVQPVRVAGGHNFTSVRAFGSHTCGTTASGEAFCWGDNSDGQLGDGTRPHRTRPVYVERPGG